LSPLPPPPRPPLFPYTTLFRSGCSRVSTPVPAHSLLEHRAGGWIGRIEVEDLLTVDIARSHEVVMPIGAAAVLFGQLLHDFLDRSEEHTSELQSQSNLVCRLLL